MLEQMIFLQYLMNYIAMEEIDISINENEIFSDASILRFIREHCFDFIFQNFEEIIMMKENQKNIKKINVFA